MLRLGDKTASFSYLQASAIITGVQIDFQAKNMMQLNENVLNYIYKDFPDSYEDKPAVYNEFIGKFGTHYFESANFGGLLYQKTIIENSYKYKADSRDIMASASGKFTKWVKFSVDVEKKKSSMNEDIDRHSETKSFYYGGLTDLSNQKDDSYLNQWQESVHKDPWLIGGKLVPIENLIMDDTKKAQLKKAIFVYRAKSYLEEFKRTRGLLGVTLPPESVALLAKIENYLDKPTGGQYDLSTVLENSKNIDKLFEIAQKIRG